MRPFEKAMFATREQELLLQAALLQGDDAVNAWNEWKKSINFEDHLDRGSFRLLPLLYKNLQCHGIADPLMSRLKGVYRLTWCENQRLFHDIGKILRYLHDAGIQTMMLKGTALTLLHYKDYGVRPMADIDILVPTSQASLTIELLQRAGWTPWSNKIDADLRYRHSRPFSDQSGREVDLHWHALSGSCKENFDSDFWDGAVSMTISDISTLALNPTDTLLHAFVHGIRRNAEPPIRWIADAMTIINSPNSNIDWERLIKQAKKNREGLRLKAALNYLRDNYQARVPREIVKDINRIHISLMERVEFRYNMKNQRTWRNPIFGPLPFFLISYLRFSIGAGLLEKVAGLPEYLGYQFEAQIKNMRQLAFYLMTKGLRKLKNSLLSALFLNNSRTTEETEVDFKFRQ